MAQVVFAADNPETCAANSVFDTLISEKNNHRVEVALGLSADEASNLLRGFFRNRMGN